MLEHPDSAGGRVTSTGDEIDAAGAPVTSRELPTDPPAWPVSAATGDRVAVLLAAVLLATLVPLAVASGVRQVTTGAPISDAFSGLLATVLGACVGALAGYVGGRRGGPPGL